MPLRTFHFFTPPFFYRCQKSVKWDGDPHLVGKWRGVKRGQYLAQLLAHSHTQQLATVIITSCFNSLKRELTRKQAVQRNLSLAVWPG